MTAGAGEWTDVCALDALEPDRGVAALVDGRQVAVFLLSGVASGGVPAEPAGGGSGRSADGLYAVDNRDPASGANVLSRGLVGSAGPVVYVASPMYKHRFDLRTGSCLDGEHLSVSVWPVRVCSGRVEVLAAGAGAARDAGAADAPGATGSGTGTATSAAGRDPR